MGIESCWFIKKQELQMALADYVKLSPIQKPFSPFRSNGKISSFNKTNITEG